MTLKELEAAVTQLPSQDLEEFTKWFEEFIADAWDRRIEEDIQSGKLDLAGERADSEFDAGSCKPI